MSKKKTSKKQEFSLEKIEHINLNPSKFEKFNPNKFFKNDIDVATALLQCLIDNDTESYMEILDSYLRVNRSKIAESSRLSRSTVSTAFAKKSNPTIKTIAKIVHEAYTLRK